MRSSPGSDGGPEAGSELTAEELRTQLDETRRQLATTEDRYVRALADLDNYRKRSERELERRTQAERDELTRGWLEVVDSIERALALQRDDPFLADALGAFLAQMDGILARQGVARMGEVGAPFDPEVHEAIAVVPDSEYPEGAIADVARPGYTVGGRVLRPAQVTVAHPGAGAG
jgi:molecular chaperone GrpE